MLKLNGKIILNCPRCGKEYDIDEYNKLMKADHVVKTGPVTSVRGDNASKEALEEIALRTGDILYEEYVDIYDDSVYDARICSTCNTEFGFVKIIRKDEENVIYRIDLDLIESNDK